ncbi:unnamed protein product, partial [Closterium sp. NIES-54]
QPLYLGQAAHTGNSHPKPPLLPPPPVLPPPPPPLPIPPPQPPLPLLLLRFALAESAPASF